MKKWEYRILTNGSSLEGYGYDGWELVSVIYLPLTSSVNYYMKREIIKK